MERIWSWVKRYSFVEGVVVGILICHWFYNEFRIDEVKERFEAKEQAIDSRLAAKESESQNLRDKLSAVEQYEQRFIAESSRAEVLERRLNDAVADKESSSRRYSDLCAMRWEEKYNTEKLACISAKEELAILHQRLNGAESQKAVADPHLIKQIEMLEEQNRILVKERDELRKLYAETPRRVPEPVAKVTRFPVELLEGVNPLDVGETVIKVMGTLKPPVDTQSFIDALSKVNSLDRYDVVKACAPALAYPLAAEQMRAVSRLVNSLDSGAAMQFLMREQAAH